MNIIELRITKAEKKSFQRTEWIRYYTLLEAINES